jgi:hypothetical protein
VKHSTRIRTLRVAAAACVLACAAPATARPADPDILGSWNVSVTTPQGQTTTAPLTLKKAGEKIVGTFSSPQGDQPVEADLRETLVTIWFSVRTQNGPLSITMKGTVSGPEMHGTVEFGDRGQGQWSAKRSAPAAAPHADARVDVTGTWLFQVDTSAGSGTPTMTFKQEGETLTGRYSGQLGEAPLSGTVKGTSVEFVIDLEADGNKVRIAYSGAVEKDAIKGQVDLGGFAEGTFTAKKKD